MATYDVYGVGNALVDIEYEVTAEQLRELEIAKGVMTLVDEAQQAQIVQRLGAHQSNRGSGGSAANTIIAVSQLGGNAFYSCRVANDEMGKFYLDDLGHAGVANSIGPAKMVPGITGKCLVLVTPDADRTMNTFLGVSADVSPRDVDVSAIAQSEYVYVEGYLVTGPASKETALYAIAQARANGIKIAFSLSDPNIVHFFRPAIDELLADGVDLLFANEDEARRIAETDDLDQAVEFVKTIARQFVITRGGDGAITYDGESLQSIAAVATAPIDTVGAGDMFAGAFLYGITQGMGFPAAGRLAAHAAARIVAVKGPRLRREELSDVFKAFEAAE